MSSMKYAKDLPIVPWEEKAGVTWNGQIRIINTSLRSENKVKYSDKLVILKQDLESWWDKLIVEMSEEMFKEEKKGGRTRTVWKISTQAAAEKAFNNDFRVSIWKLWYEYAEKKPQLDSAIAKNRIKSTLALRQQIIQLSLETKALNDQMIKIFNANYKHKYELKILETITNALPQVRLKLLSAFREFLAIQISDGIYAIEETFFAPLKELLWAYFIDGFWALNEFMKMNYLWWALEIPTLKDPLKKEIEAWKKDYEDKMQDPYTQADYLPQYNLFKTEAEEINRLWEALPEKIIEVMAIQMNARNWYIKHKSRSEAISQATSTDVYWFTRLTERDQQLLETGQLGTKKLPQPYMPYTKNIKIVGVKKPFPVTLRASMLLHEIDDSGWLPTQSGSTATTFALKDPTGKMLYGFEALFYQNFTILNTIAGDQETKKFFTNSFKELIEEKLKEIKEKLDGNPEKDPEAKSIEQLLVGGESIKGISARVTAAKERLDEIERTDFTRKYSDIAERSVIQVQVTILKDRIGKIEIMMATREELGEVKKLAFDVVDISDLDLAALYGDLNKIFNEIDGKSATMRAYAPFTQAVTELCKTEEGEAGAACANLRKFLNQAGDIQKPEELINFYRQTRDLYIDLLTARGITLKKYPRRFTQPMPAAPSPGESKAAKSLESTGPVVEEGEESEEEPIKKATKKASKKPAAKGAGGKKKDATAAASSDDVPSSLRETLAGESKAAKEYKKEARKAGVRVNDGTGKECPNCGEPVVSDEKGDYCIACGWVPEFAD